MQSLTGGKAQRRADSVEGGAGEGKRGRWGRADSVEGRARGNKFTSYLSSLLNHHQHVPVQVILGGPRGALEDGHPFQLLWCREFLWPGILQNDMHDLHNMRALKVATQRAVSTDRCHIGPARLGEGHAAQAHATQDAQVQVARTRRQGLEGAG